MGNIIELGFLVEPKQVRLVEGGTVYKLPPDIPVPLLLMLEHYAESDFTAEFIETLYGRILALFQVYQPDLKELPIGIDQMVRLVTVVYYGEAAQEAPPPTKQKPAGTRSSRAKRAPKRSRSSS